MNPNIPNNNSIPLVTDFRRVDKVLINRQNKNIILGGQSISRVIRQHDEVEAGMSFGQKYFDRIAILTFTYWLFFHCKKYVIIPIIITVKKVFLRKVGTFEA